MTRKSAIMLPVTPATVDVNGSAFGPRSLIWAGLIWARAEIGGNAADQFLSVPWCHPNDAQTTECGWYRVRSLDQNYRFVRAMNGQFVLRSAP